MSVEPRPPSLDATVIVNSYQQASTLDLVLAGLVRQDFPGSWEIFIVDDGSTDDTARVVAAHADASATPILHLRQADQGYRWATARNRGVRLASGRVLIFLDADMVPAREVVRLHVHGQEYQQSLIAGNRLWRDPEVDLAGITTPAEQLDRLASLDHSADPTQRRREEYEIGWRLELLASPLPWRAWFGCHTSVPASSAIRFDESMTGWGPGDIELGCRLHHQHGLPVRYLPEARAWHLEHPHAVHNVFRAGDSAAVTEYVRQICYMINSHPGLDLENEITRGFDRITLGQDGLWSAVPRGMGGDIQEILRQALRWYADRRLQPKLCGEPRPLMDEDYRDG